MPGGLGGEAPGDVSLSRLGAFMFARTLVAFLVLPGMVAGFIPALIFSFDPWRGSGLSIGYLFLGVGLFLLLWCVRDFHVFGNGTLAPWEPPRSLVIVGLYRYVRNPMYESVLVILPSWCLASGSVVMVVYSLTMGAMFHIRVKRNEEKWLARQFPEVWSAYSQSVGRWLPRLKPWHSNQTGT